MTFANLYAPNNRQDAFLQRHLRQILQFSEEQMIMGGDLNILLTPHEDTSTGTSSTLRDMRKWIGTVLHSVQMVDAWRLFHPGERDYKFFSKPHQAYSRIDYFLIPHRCLQAVRDTAIGSITWSDHAPITLRYVLSDIRSAPLPPWRLNESLLQDPEVLTDVVKEIGHYFTSNDTPDSDPGWCGRHIRQ